MYCVNPLVLGKLPPRRLSSGKLPPGMLPPGKLSFVWLPTLVLLWSFFTNKERNEEMLAAAKQINEK